MSTKRILTLKTVNTIINRLASEIIEAAPDLGDLVFIGVQRGGVPVAEKTAAAIQRFEHVSVPVGQLDISFYRDDLGIKKEQVTVNSSDMPFDVTEKTVILFDDVLFSGRTVRAALDSIRDWGRPRVIKLAVLIDRGHRQLPIEANFVGKQVQTNYGDSITIDLNDPENTVLLMEQGE